MTEFLNNQKYAFEESNLDFRLNRFKIKELEFYRALNNLVQRGDMFTPYGKEEIQAALQPRA
jgi:hypothetical protein